MRQPLCAAPLGPMLLAVACLALVPRAARAAYTETLPAGTFLLEGTFVMAWLDSRWNGASESVAVVDPIERYEPGGGLQGVITAEPAARYTMWVSRLQYGILDGLSLGVGVPVVLETTVDPHLGWEPGDYQPGLGRAYGEQDFWDWAESMGQTRPGPWIGNQGVLSDIVLGLRLRWTEWVPGAAALGLESAFSIYGALPTGRAADPEELAAAGTTLWDLHFQGDLAFHLSLDKRFDRELDGRLTIGVDLFYEVFFPRERTAPTGAKHPLLLNRAPYVGETYDVKPGDFSGVGVAVDVVPYKGPEWDTWITKGDPARAAALPPLLTLSVRYTFVHLQQSDWRSDFPLWDWEQEKLWQPGFKNVLDAALTLSFLRLGVPLDLYVSGRSMTLLPGKNTRASDVVSAGFRIPLKFW